MGSTSIRLDDYLDDEREPGEPIPTISLGEDEDNGDAAYAEAITGCNDARRLTDVQTALEELQLIADQIDNATEKDILLVDTALSAAVAGTDISPDEIAPGLEHYVGKRISTEGIGSFIKAIWDTIMGILKRIWNMFADFFKALFGRATRTEKRAKKLEEEFRQKHGAKTKQAAFILGGEATNLIMDGKHPTHKADLDEALKANEKLLVDLEKYIVVCNSVGSKVKEAIDRFDEDKAEASLDSITEALEDVAFNKSGLDIHPLNSDQRYKSGVTFAGYSIAGNKRVVAVLPLVTAVAEPNVDSITKNNAARATKYELDAHIANLNLPVSPSFKAITGQEGQDIAQRVEAASVKLKAFSEKYGDLETKSKEVKAVTKACETLTKRLDTKKKDLQQNQYTAFQNAVKVAVTYTDLMSKFIMQVIRQVEMTNEAINTVLKRALDNLE